MADADEGGERDDETPRPQPRGAWDDLVGPMLAILIVAAVLRLWSLTTNPPELFEDELSGAVSAWSIATTGHDVERTVLPFLVTRLELKQPLYFVATLPFQAVLGHGALADRLPAVLFGLAATGLLGAFAARVTGRPVVGVVAAGLFAVSPWAVHYGRAGWEPAAVLPFTLGGLLLLWTALEEHRPRRSVAAAAVLAIGAYAYHPALLMHVVLAGVVVVVQGRSLRRADMAGLAVGAAAALVILVPYGLAARDPLFFSRARAISIFRDGVTADAFAMAWHNYWASWDPSFLLGGAAPNPRINPGPAVMVATVPFILAGLDRLAHWRSKADLLLLAWLVVGPLPVALTNDQTIPSLARGLFALPPLMIVGGIGAVRIVEWIMDRSPADGREVAARAATLVLGAAVFVGVWSWTDVYFTTYPVRSAGWWGYGTSAAFAMARADVPGGSTVCIATNDVSGFTFPHHVALYLPDHPFEVIEGIKDPRCSQPGTYVLALARRTLEQPTVEIGTVPGFDGNPLFRLSQVTGG